MESENQLWYAGTTAQQPTMDGMKVSGFCETFLEEYEELLIEFFRHMKDSKEIQQTLCVDMSGICKTESLIKMAKAYVTRMQATLAEQAAQKQSQSTKGATSNKKKNKKKKKKKHTEL